MSSPAGFSMRRASVAVVGVALALGSLPAVAADTLDEIEARSLEAWNTPDPSAIAELYAPDAVHTATFYDRTIVHEGVDAIAQVVTGGGIESVAPRVDLPAPDSEYRWVTFASLAGGTACLWRAVEGMITRQDCLVPEHSWAARPKAGSAEGDSSATIDEIMDRLRLAWESTGDGTAALEAAYTSDAVHTARFLDQTRSYDGPEDIGKVTGMGRQIERVGPRVVFEAPDGELAWAEANDLAGGSVCLFRARDRMIFRHDCVLPVRA